MAKPKTQPVPRTVKSDDKELPATHLKVRSLQAGFRRAGRAWPVESVEVPIDELDEDAISALLDEPMLSVQLIALPPQPPVTAEK